MLPAASAYLFTARPWTALLGSPDVCRLGLTGPAGTHCLDATRSNQTESIIHGAW